jgi:serine phosphatase RsbU (regulator of sigma subunit)
VEFARKLNAFLVETLPLGTFVTAVLLMLPAQLAPGAELRILNFGFAPVFFHSRKEGKVTIRVLKPNLQPLGLDGLAIDTQSALVVPLELGLKVSTFSDGLVDLVNPAGTRFGEDSVKDFLRRSYRWDSQEFLQHLTEEMAAFQKSAPQPDDITILTLQF